MPPNKYRSQCLLSKENDLKKILKDININIIDGISVNDLTKNQICWFLDQNYKTADVVFSK